MAILIFKSDIFKSSNKFVFYVILNICLYFFSAKKEYVKNIEIFLKKSKKKNSIVVNVTKISQKMKNRSLLTIEKIL